MTAPPNGRSADEGSAVVEFSLISVLLLTLLLGIAQVAVYVHIRNVATASAAEGARYGANADVDPAAGGARAEQILARAVGADTSDAIACAGTAEAGPDGVELAVVRCEGAIPVFFVPVGEVLPIDVRARAVKEGT